MHIVGRYHRVRGLGASGWTLPYVLCRKKSFWPRTLVPYRNDEWLEYEDRLHPVLRRRNRSPTEPRPTPPRP